MGNEQPKEKKAKYMNQLIHPKSSITAYATRSIRCPVLRRLFLLIPLAVACFALSPVPTQAAGKIFHITTSGLGADVFFVDESNPADPVFVDVSLLK